MRTLVLFMSTNSLSNVSFDVSPVVSYKNWSSPPWNLTWMTTIFFWAASALRLFHGFSWGAVDGVCASQVVAGSFFSYRRSCVALVGMLAQFYGCVAKSRSMRT